ncbi:MAG: LptA/OstA family protein [Nitratireductor sp.]
MSGAMFNVGNKPGFAGNVSLVLFVAVILHSGHGHAQQPTANAAPPQPTASAFALGDRSQPADIRADRLEVQDGKGLAIFDGNVKVVQGRTSLETVKLTVSYAGSPDAGAGNGPDTTTGANALAGNIRTISADGDVRMNTGNQNVSAASAVVDMEQSVATLTGSVKLSQGDSAFETEVMDILFGGDAGQPGDGIRKVLAPGKVRLSSPRQTAEADSAVVEMAERIANLSGNVIVSDGNGILNANNLAIEYQSGDGEETLPGSNVKRILASGRVRLKSGSQIADADTLEVRMADELAVLNGNVIVNDGQSSIRTNLLNIEFLPDNRDGAQGVGGVRKITAPGRVVLQSKDQTASANSAVVDMPRQTATLVGNVRVEQGSSVLTTARLTVSFLRGSGGAKSAPGGLGGGIRQIDAPGKVRLTSADQVVTADRAVVRMQENHAYLIGNVVLSQGKNVVKGCELDFNLATNFAQMKSCPDAGAGRVKMLFTPKSAGNQ